MCCAGWCRTVVLVGSMTALAACQSQDREPEAPLADDAPAATAPPAEADVPSTSALAFHRGIVDETDFRPCDAETPLVLLDQTGGTLQAIRSGLSDSAAGLYVEARGERLDTADPPAFMLEEVLYAATPGEGGGCDRPPPDYQVLARGNEPFWSAEVRDATTIFRQVDEPAEIVLGPAESVASEGSVVYLASGDGHELELLIAGHSCRDSMSGEFFAYAVRATLDDRKLLGCARVGE